jgi:ribonuclease P protein component
MLPPKNRLKTSDIKKIFDVGKKFRGEYGMIVVSNSKEEFNKYAFVVSKKIGNAVMRHRMTRLLREIARGRSNTDGVKIVYVAFKYCNEYEKLKDDFNKLFNKAIESN